MPDFKSQEKLCMHCGHRLESHQENGICNGKSNEDDGPQWCIANCKKFWD